MFIKGQRGFTLVEVVLTAGIIALVGSMAALAFPAMVASARLTQAVTQITGGIREAQIQALRENRPWRVVLDADGRGFSLQYASDTAAASWRCDSTGWTEVRHEALPQTVQFGQSALSCLAYSETGRADWPAPQVEVFPGPSNSAVWAIARLTDGQQLEQSSLPAVITTDPAVVGWRGSNPVVTLSFQELRYFSDLCVGTFEYPSTTVRYPRTVRLDGAGTSGTWTTIYNGPGPTSPGGGGRYRTCFTIPVNSHYSELRLTITRNTAVANAWVVIDEIDGVDLFINVQGQNKSKRLVINSVTGRVTVR